MWDNYMQEKGNQKTFTYKLKDTKVESITKMLMTHTN
jgi:hypothetical protein